MHHVDELFTSLLTALADLKLDPEHAVQTLLNFHKKQNK